VEIACGIHFDMRALYFVGNCGPDSPDPEKRIEYRLVERMAKEGWEIHATIRPSPGLSEYVQQIHDDRRDWRRPQPWESSPAKVQEIQDAMMRLEERIGTTLRRCLYADRNLNRMYTFRNHDAPAGPLRKHVRDHPLASERMVMRYFFHYRDVFDRVQPNVALIHSFAGAPNLIVAFLCEDRGIPYFCPASSMTSYRRLRFRNHYLFHHHDKLQIRYQELDASQAPPSESALAYIQEFQNVNTHFVEWDQTGERKRIAAMRPAAVLQRTVNMAIAEAKRGVKWVLGISRERYLSRAFFLSKGWYWLLAGQRFRRRLALFQDRTAEELAEANYIYLPLHQDPEEMLMTGAPAWGEAGAMVELLSKMVPSGYQLYVREHMDNIALRPEGFYKQLARLPGVTLVDPRCPSTKFIANANLVVTVQGTTGWEALLFDRPVVTLNLTYYDMTGLTHKVRDINRLDEQFLEILGQHPTIDRTTAHERLGRLIDADTELSFDTEALTVDDGIRRMRQAAERHRVPDARSA
jgi:hypothetical protein